MVAYVYSRLRFRARKPLMNISLILGMFPGFMSMIAIYHFMKAVGLDQTLLALILVYSGSAGAELLHRQGLSLTRMPQLAGRGRHRWTARPGSTIFWKIILPNAKPVDGDHGHQRLH